MERLERLILAELGIADPYGEPEPGRGAGALAEASA